MNSGRHNFWWKDTPCSTVRRLRCYYSHPCNCYICTRSAFGFTRLDCMKLELCRACDNLDGGEDNLSLVWIMCLSLWCQCEPFGVFLCKPLLNDSLMYVKNNTRKFRSFSLCFSGYFPASPECANLEAFSSVSFASMRRIYAIDLLTSQTYGSAFCCNFHAPSW